MINKFSGNYEIKMDEDYTILYNYKISTLNSILNEFDSDYTEKIDLLTNNYIVNYSIINNNTMNITYKIKNLNSFNNIKLFLKNNNII